MKPPIARIVLCILACTISACFGYRSIAREDLRFLDAQPPPLLLPDVTKRLGHTELGDGPCYAYTLRGRENTVEFWLLPPPETLPPEGAPAEIGMVVERTRGAAAIIWPAALLGSDVEAAKRRFYPKMYSLNRKGSNQVERVR